MKSRTEIVTITKVVDRTAEKDNFYAVSYEGGMFDGVLSDQFHPKPEVGQVWKLTSDFNYLISAELIS